VSDAQSPCMKTCKLADKICQSCFRHLDDIAGWARYTVDQKRAANALASERKQNSETSTCDQ